MKKDFATLRKLADWVVELGLQEAHFYDFRYKNGDIKLRVYISGSYVSIETDLFSVNIGNHRADFEFDVNKDNDIADIISEYQAVSIPKLVKLVKYELRYYYKNKENAKRERILAQIDELEQRASELKGQL